MHADSLQSKTLEGSLSARQNRLGNPSKGDAESVTGERPEVYAVIAKWVIALPTLGSLTWRIGKMHLGPWAWAMNRSLIDAASVFTVRETFMVEPTIQFINHRTRLVARRTASNTRMHLMKLGIRALDQFKDREPLTTFSPNPALTNPHLEGCA